VIKCKRVHCHYLFVVSIDYQAYTATELPASRCVEIADEVRAVDTAV
jgi:hypothetical protein